MRVMSLLLTSLKGLAFPLLFIEETLGFCHVWCLLNTVDQCFKLDPPATVLDCSPESVPHCCLLHHLTVSNTIPASSQLWVLVYCINSLISCSCSILSIFLSTFSPVALDSGSTWINKHGLDLLSIILPSASLFSSLPLSWCNFHDSYMCTKNDICCCSRRHHHHWYYNNYKSQ